MLGAFLDQINILPPALLGGLCALAGSLFGGFFALCGSLLSNFLQYRFKVHGDNAARRREKLEKFVVLVNQMKSLCLRPDTLQPLEQTQKWNEISQDMLLITQLHLPELLPACSEIVEGCHALMQAGQEMMHVSEEDPDNSEANLKAETEFLNQREVSQRAWEFGMDEVQTLAGRMGMWKKFKLLSPYKIKDDRNPPMHSESARNL